MSDSSLAVVPAPGGDANAAAPAPDPILRNFDPDDAELAEARAAVAAELAAAPAAPAAPVVAPTEPAPAPAMVPHARFQEVNAEMQRWRDAAAYHEGRAKALETAAPPAAPAAPAAPPGPPPEWAEAEAIEAGWTKAATDYENGATTATDLAAEQVQLLGRLLKMHVGAGMAAVKQEVAAALRGLQPQVGVVDRQVMAQHVTSLEAAHPWSTQLNQTEADLLTGMARAEAAAMGKSYPAGPAGTMALQQRVAEMASFYMPQWHPGTEPPAATTPNPQPPTAATPPQRPPGPTQADVLEAARRQAALPPNTPSAHGANSGPITLDRVNTMTDDELEKMAPADRKRLLGISS